MKDSTSSFEWLRRSGALLAFAAILVAALYLTGLTRMGMYSVDEPRYADIGRTMAHSGDWTTPKLWGEAWFEKPPLLYWMTAVGFDLGAGNDLAPRLPVALLSIGFLVFFFRRLAVVFDPETARYATAMLATSGGWLAYSHVAVTDLPLSVCFSTAVLFALPGRPGPVGERAEPRRALAAAALGLAVLAKSLPPLILFTPILAMDYRNWRRWFARWPILVFLAVAVPWHVAAAVRNGSPFLYELFIKQQFGRFFTNALQHEQPWWFYLGVFPLLLFPWFPLLIPAARRVKEDESAAQLAVVVVVGFVFFSLGVNKLYGYVLPLVPATCALMGYGVAREGGRTRWILATLALTGVLPFAPAIASRAPVAWAWILVSAVVLAGGGWMLGSVKRGILMAALATGIFYLGIEGKVFSALDHSGSLRSEWVARHPSCAALVLPRGTLYGLYYYAGKRLPDCAIVDKNAPIIDGSGPTK